VTRQTLMRLVLSVIVALVLVPAATARTPRPDCGKPHCKIHYVGYSYTQRGHDQYGNQYVRTCHVSARGARHCGAWRLP